VFVDYQEEHLAHKNPVGIHHNLL